MTLTEIAHTRLISQQLLRNDFRNPGELAGWMGAMQAQDYLMSEWAMGIRLPGTGINDIREAIDKGDVIRTHLMRPTWHLVSSADAYQLLRLTAPRIKASMKTRNRNLGLTTAILDRCRIILSEALSNGNHMTREELIILLKQEGIRTDENRASHIFANAELDALICSGKIKNSKQTYALLSERVPIGDFNREKALGDLAGKYFSSHGPATLQDFTWWSGLTSRDARSAIESCGSEIKTIDSGSLKFFTVNNFTEAPADTPVHLLPAYDEFLISYHDRSAAIIAKDHKRIISINGIFKPVVLVNGQVEGLWKKTSKGEKLTIEADMFRRPSKKLKEAIAEKAHALAKFSGKVPEVIFTF